MELLSSTSSQNFASALTSNTGAGVTSLITVVALAVGIPLAFYVIKGIMGLFPKHRGSR